jgi:hypothetical protein
MDEESNSTSTELAPTNPYLMALLILAGVAGATAIILGLTAGTLDRQGYDKGDILVWAGAFGVVGFTSFLLWLVGKSITWKPSA